jgi:hypothetical protein
MKEWSFACKDMKFIVDSNVGKIAKWLRLMGFDALFFNGQDDSEMILTALAEDRVILTRDTQLMKWGVITSSRLRAILIESDEADSQIRQVIKELNLDSQIKPFTICLECNQPLREASQKEVEDRVPPYVYRTQRQFMECPNCHRAYWRGTHWQAMLRKLDKLRRG